MCRWTSLPRVCAIEKKNSRVICHHASEIHFFKWFAFIYFLNLSRHHQLSLQLMNNSYGFNRNLFVCLADENKTTLLLWNEQTHTNSKLCENFSAHNCGCITRNNSARFICILGWVNLIFTSSNCYFQNNSRNKLMIDWSLNLKV